MDAVFHFLPVEIISEERFGSIHGADLKVCQVQDCYLQLELSMGGLSSHNVVCCVQRAFEIFLSKFRVALELDSIEECSYSKY